MYALDYILFNLITCLLDSTLILFGRNYSLETPWRERVNLYISSNASEDRSTYLFVFHIPN